jgi:hypothetical protein
MERTAVKSCLVIASLVSLAAPCVAGGQDPKAGLVLIGTRFVEVQSRTAHKAGDADQQFIEDVVIPSVHAVVDEGGSAMTNAERDAVIAFLRASANYASEEVSEIALALYTSQKLELCASLAKLPRSERAIVLDRVKSGMANMGKPAPRRVCP